MNVYQKLNEARERFHSKQLKKTGHNKFAGYDYFELGDFLIPAMQVFKEVGLCATVSFPGERATLTVRNVEKPDETITFESPMGSAALKGCHEVQNIGAVETYQRRYLWVAALEIVEHDALDAITGSDKGNKVQPIKRGGVVADVLQESPALPTDEQEWLMEFALDVSRAFTGDGAPAAYELIESKKLDDLQKIFLWNNLASDVRSAIKKYSISVNTKKAAA
jgi:hypothetical protein